MITGTATLKGSYYFEFVKNSDRKEPFWNQAAWFLEGSVFHFFLSIFQQTSIKFNYHYESRFGESELIELKSLLVKFEDKLKFIQCFEDFESLFDNIIKFEYDEENDKDMWRNNVSELIVISQKLRKIADECNRNKEILWILGL